MIKSLALQNYTGIDVSSNAIEIAKQKSPDVKFILYTGKNDAAIPQADTVLCLEVLIHQKTLEDYKKVSDFLAQKTKRRLIVSGYIKKEWHDDQNHMLGYHESLFDSLSRTGKFSTIRQVGALSDMAILLAEVKTSAIETFSQTVTRSLRTVRSLLFRSH